jgi:hypothetical protein
MIVNKRVKYETKREVELDEEYSDEIQTIVKLVSDRAFVGKKLSEHTKYVKNIIENPFEEYEKLSTRLNLYGKDVSFPEFEGVVVTLMKDIIATKTTGNPYLSVIKEQSLIKLASLLFSNRVFLPYRQSIITISDSLFFFDVVQRTSEENANTNPFFHTRRYYFYQNMLLGESNCVLFPSVYGIGSTDLIKVRCVPVFFLGVSTKQLFVDEYINTSVEFYFHDIQHARRMLYYNEHYFDTVYKHKNYEVSRSSYDTMNIKDMYKESAEFTKNTIIPLLAIENQYHERLSGVENAVVKFHKMIIFEIVHEGAFFMSKDVILAKLLEKECNTPVESIIKSTTDYPDIINTMYADPPLLSNLMYKLQSSFYDTEDDRQEYIVPVKYRFSKYAVMSAQKIISWLRQDTEDFTELLCLLIKYSDKRPEPPKGYSIIENE